MAFKNALKMLVSKFGLMWVLLLYIIITGAIVVSLSLPFALPVLRVFKSEGVGKLIYSLFSSSSVGDGIDVRNEKQPYKKPRRRIQHRRVDSFRFDFCV